DDGSPAKTVAFPGVFDLGPPPEPTGEPERIGPGLNLFAAPKGPQLGPRSPMESGSYGRPNLDAFPPQGNPMQMPMAQPAPPAPVPYGVPPAPMATFPGPAGMPQMSASNHNSSRPWLILVAVLALIVVAGLTFIFLRYRSTLLPG
ncbi:MAG: hypothetical protein ABI193_12515, partial [Minicystis sp.]